MTTTTKQLRNPYDRPEAVAERRSVADRAAAAFRKSGIFGVSVAEEAPFGIAVLLFGVIAGSLIALNVIGTIVLAILPQIGGGLAIGLAIGFYVVYRKRTPARSTATGLVVAANPRDVTTR